MFGLVQSSFILEGTLEFHFDNYGQEFQDVVKKVKNDMYVDDLVTEEESINQVKSGSISFFREGGLN